MFCWWEINLEVPWQCGLWASESRDGAADYLFFLFNFLTGVLTAGFLAAWGGFAGGLASFPAAFDLASGFAAVATGAGVAATATGTLPFFPFGADFADCAAAAEAAAAASAAAFAARPRRGAGGGGGGGGANGFRNFRVSVRERSFPSSRSMNTSCASLGYSGSCGVMSSSVISGNGSFCWT